MRALQPGLSNRPNRSRSASSCEMNNRKGNVSSSEQKLRTSAPTLQSFSPYTEKKSPKGAPPPPPIRRSSSGNISSRSDGDIGSTTKSDPTPSRGPDRTARNSLTSFFQRKT